MKAPKGFVGLYISGDKLEAVLPAGADGSIEEIYTYPIPPDLVTDEGMVADPGELANVLKEAWKTLKLKHKKVVLTLNSRHAIVRLVRLPHLPLNLLHHAILSEAEQFALFRNDVPQVDYFVAGEDGDFIWVCYGAAADSLLGPWEATMKSAGLKLAGIDLVQLAGQRGMAYYHPPAEQQWIGIMLIPQRLVVTSWQDGRLTAVRELVLPERDNISMELVALNYLPDAVRSVAGANPTSEPQLVIGAQRAEDARELAANAEAHLKLPIYIAEPGDVDPDAELPSVVALGLGLWGRTDTFPSFNLARVKKGGVGGLGLNLPKLNIEIPGLSNLNLGAATGVIQGIALPLVACLVIAGAVLLGGNLYKSQQEDRIRGLQVRLNAAQNDRNEMLRKANETPPDIEVLRKWIPPRSESEFATDLVSRMRNLIPADAWITRVSYLAGAEVRVQGATLNQTSCLYFADQLGALDAVTQVRVLRLEKQDSAYAFELQASLGRRAGTGGL